MLASGIRSALDLAAPSRAHFDSKDAGRSNVPVSFGFRTPLTGLAAQSGLDEAHFVNRDSGEIKAET
jgi:hypothetical protein